MRAQSSFGPCIGIFGIFFSVLFSVAFEAAAEQPSPEVPASGETFECGKYQLRGRLRVDSPQGDLLELYSGSTRRFSVTLVGLSASEGVGYGGETVEVDVQIYRAGAGPLAAARALKPLRLVSKELALREPIRILLKMPCLVN